MNEQSTNKQHPMCGTCRWWVRNSGDGVKQGDCYLNPPAMTPGGQKIPRPNMRDTERGCSHHAQLPEGEDVAVRRKFADQPVPLTKENIAETSQPAATVPSNQPQTSKQKNRR